MPLRRASKFPVGLFDRFVGRACDATIGHLQQGLGRVLPVLEDEGSWRTSLLDCLLIKWVESVEEVVEQAVDHVASEAWACTRDDFEGALDGHSGNTALGLDLLFEHSDCVLDEGFSFLDIVHLRLERLWHDFAVTTAYLPRPVELRFAEKDGFVYRLPRIHNTACIHNTGVSL